LIVAATVRGDAIERQRLAGSDPSRGFAVPHHYGLATALAKAADFHLLTLLDLAASYWQWWGLWGWHGQRRRGNTVRDQGGAGDAGDAPAGDAEGFRLYGMVRYPAFLFLTPVEGWKQFCGDVSMDPDVRPDFMPGWDMVTRTQAPARQRAFTRQEAALFLLSETPLAEGTADEELDLPHVLRVEGLARDWHTFLGRREEAVLGQGRC
jgi:hypothetical protein